MNSLQLSLGQIDIQINLWEELFLNFKEKIVGVTHVVTAVEGDKRQLEA